MKGLLIGLPVVIAGGIIGAALMGAIDIPGITPAKKGAPAAKSETKKAAPKKSVAPLVSKEPPRPSKKAELPAPDVSKGQVKLARLWTEVPTSELVKLVKGWKDPELAGVLLKMDSAKSAEVLVALGDKRASRLSREIQRQASIVSPGASR